MCLANNTRVNDIKMEGGTIYLEMIGCATVATQMT
jgi:hypothetical protein